MSSVRARWDKKTARNQTLETVCREDVPFSIRDPEPRELTRIQYARAMLSPRGNTNKKGEFGLKQFERRNGGLKHTYLEEVNVPASLTWFALSHCAWLSNNVGLTRMFWKKMYLLTISSFKFVWSYSGLSGSTNSLLNSFRKESYTISRESSSWVGLKSVSEKDASKRFREVVNVKKASVSGWLIP